MKHPGIALGMWSAGAAVPALFLFMMAAHPNTGVTAYAIPKEHPPAQAVTAAGDELTWTAPAAWHAAAVSATRKGSYAVTGAHGAEADLSITAFPGNAGGELANVNRWRSQVQLPPLTSTDSSAVLMRLRQNGLAFTVVDISGGPADQPRRILGAIVPVNGATWFFTLSGPESAVAEAKPSFLAFLETVKPR